MEKSRATPKPWRVGDARSAGESSSCRRCILPLTVSALGVADVGEGGKDAVEESVSLALSSLQYE